MTRSMFLAALLLVAAASVQSRTTTLNILHTNDVHARFDQASISAGVCNAANAAAGLCYGGYARIASVVKQYRVIDPETLLLDAGDQYTGTFYDLLYRGNITGEGMSMLGVNAATMGNHEFDFRIPQLVSNLASYNFPRLGLCNIDISRQPLMEGALQKFAMFNVKGFRVAVIGLLTTETNFADIVPTDNVTVTDELTGLRRCLREMRSAYPARPDVTILLSHVGYSMDLMLAAQVAGIDLVIGGHSHSFLYGNPNATRGPTLNVNPNVSSSWDNPWGPYPTYVQSNVTRNKVVPVATAAWGSRYLGSLQLTMNITSRRLVSVRGTPILLGGIGSSNPVMPDPAMAAWVAEKGAAINAFQTQVIGRASVPIRRAPYGNESAIGNLATAAAAAYWRSTWEPQLNGPLYLVLQNSGGLRADIAPGPISVGDAFAVQPFGNLLAVKQFDGYQIYLALEVGVSNLGTTNSGGRFPQVAGMRFVYDARRPSGQRIIKVTLVKPDGTQGELDSCKTYNLASFDYIFSGGDGYTPLAPPYGRTLVAAGPSQEVPTINYISANSPLTPFLDGRIVGCNGVATDDPACSLPPATWAPCPTAVDPTPV
ncbi:hypothetical protein QJQ45_016346 [Haematococcus lacustris]|nr:hypothetical protein QJQ45_016346 [Haematococcus lacustris]